MTTPTLHIRAATEADSQSVWDIIHEVIAGGDTYAFARHATNGLTNTYIMYRDLADQTS